MNLEALHEITVTDLVGQVIEALYHFWGAHEESTEHEEDEIPTEVRDRIHREVVARAKSDLAKKSLAEVRTLDGDSRYAYTLRCRMVEHYLEWAGAEVEKHFARITYV